MLVFQEQVLIQGPKPLTRIHVRSDLVGLEVLPDTFVAIEGERHHPVEVRQYSFMAFARFFYNRICKAVDGDYEWLPAPPTASISHTGTTSPRSPAFRQLDPQSAVIRPPLIGPKSEVKTTSTECPSSRRDDIKTPDIRQELKVTLMSQLRVSVTPHRNPKVEPKDIFTEGAWLSYVEAVDQNAKNHVLWLAQLRGAVCALSALGRNE